jgi:hypothetical protein
MEQVQPKVVVHIAEGGGQLDCVWPAGYLVSQTSVATGRLGWPLHTNHVVTYVRLRSIKDPAILLIETLAKSSRSSCLSASTLLNHMDQKFSEFGKLAGASKNGGGTQKKTVEAQLQKAKDIGLLPDDFVPEGLARELQSEDTGKIARAERLKYWMKRQDSKFGLLSGGEQAAVHVDGSVGRCKGMLCARRAGSLWTYAELTAVEMLSLKGYSPDVLNVSVASPTSLSSLVDKIPAFPVVLVATLAAVASIRPLP